MIRQLIFLVAFVLCSSVVQRDANGQITSKSAGGVWAETSTWMGGQVPTAGDDVVVNGPVIIRGGDTCHNLTVNVGASLRDYVGYLFVETLVVTGNVANHGTIEDASQSEQLSLRIQGDVFNDGEWSPSFTTLDGSGDQVLSLGGSADFSGQWTHSNATGTISAGSALSLSNFSLNLQNHALGLAGVSITLDETVTISSGTLQGTFSINGTLRALLNNLTLTGTITNNGIIEGHPGGLFVDVLSVNGTLVNRGTIRDGSGGELAIRLNGSAVNEGEWDILETRFIGADGQTLSHTSGHPLNGGWRAADSVTVSAASDLSFDDANVDLSQGALQMLGHALTMSNVSNIKNAVVDTRELVMNTGGTMGGTLRFTGDVTLRGVVQVYAGTVFDGPVTVADSLRDAPGGLFVETVEFRDRIRNEGVISGRLSVLTFADLVNAGKWEADGTYLDGSGAQTLSTENGAAFGGTVVHRNTAGTVAAGSDIAFSNGTLDLQNRTFELDGVVLTMDETATTRHGTLSGTFTTDGIFQVLSNDLKMEGVVTNQGIIESHPGGLAVDALTFKGTLINRGTIRDGSSRQLFLAIDGQAVNEGDWAIAETRFVGSGNQLLSIAPGRSLGGGWGAGDSVVIQANSALVFDGAGIDLRQGLLDMNGNPLALQGPTTLANATIDTRELTMSRGARTAGIWKGPITLRGLVQVFSGTVFQGPVTVTDTLRDAPGGLAIETVEMQQLLRNEGVIQGQLYVRVQGTVENQGEWANARTYLDGAGRRTIRNAATITSPLEVSGADVSLTGTIDVSSLTISNGATARVSGEGTLRLPTGGLKGATAGFENFGRISVHGPMLSRRAIAYYDAVVTFPDGATFDTLTVTAVGNQVPETYGSAIKNWWHLENNGGNGGTVGRLLFRYADDQVGPNDEANLEVYHSTDGGDTWAQISTSQNLTRDPDGNSVSILNPPASGDFVVSSVADPVSVVPNVVFSVTGRPAIRIGAPTRYVVSYVNAGDQPSGDLLVALALDPGGHVEQIQQRNSDGSISTIVPDDFVVTDINDDRLAMMYITSLDPGEERLFTLIASADQTAGKQELSVIALGIGAVAVIGGPLLVSAMLDLGTVACGEFRDQIVSGREADVAAAFQAALDQTADKYNNLAQVWNEVVHNFVNSIIERRLGVFDNAIDFGKAVLACGKDALDVITAGIVSNTHLSEWGPALARIRCAARQACDGGDKRDARPGADLPSFINTLGASPGGIIPRTASPTGVAACSYCPKVYGTSISLQAVRSWDPNEKSGPFGYGLGGFVTSAGTMNYTIQFENKADATAPAYRIVVHDTLSSVLDPESVEFGRASHEGFIMERTGNVLRWEIEGIELPPNVNPPEGEGFVSFSVNTLEALPSGTKIANRATIVFDANPPITTNEVLNTLDFLPPTTAMQPLAQNIEGAEVVVRWNSIDPANGSGVGTVNVYQSVNGSGFLLIGSTGADSLAIEALQDGQHRYYALAVDRVGNAESVRPAIVETFVTVVDVADEDVSFSFDLQQNYPNPFNRTTTIEYSVDKDALTSLDVYDLTGRLVARLVDGMRSPGRYQVAWDPEGKASGLYFAALRQGERVEVKSLVLVR